MYSKKMIAGIMLFLTTILQVGSVSATELKEIPSVTEQESKNDKDQDIVEVQNREMNDEVVAATEILEQLLSRAYEKTEQDVKNECFEKGYDYSLTMESFYEQGNPFADMDYVGVLAAYCTAMGNDNKSTVCDMDFITVKYTETDQQEYVPVKTYEYEDAGNGLYKRSRIKYITQPGSYDTFEDVGNGLYKKCGKEQIDLEQNDLKYATVELDPVTPESILAFYGKESEKEDYERRRDEMTEWGMSSEILSQNVFIKTAVADTILDPDAKAQLEAALSEAQGNRFTLLSTAAALIGQVPYLWGGKSSMPGYDTTWWTFNEEGKQKGLDCSGYLSWIYRTAGYPDPVWQSIISSQAVLANCEEIPYEELQIGDIGVLNRGEGINHVGMYIGNGYFIHCSSGAGTVTVTKGSHIRFSVFMRVPSVDTDTINPYNVVLPSNGSGNYTQEDIYLLAQTVMHEANGEGMNGWVAVAEVIKNRINSDRFPNTIRDVVYQPGQFSHNEEIASMQPNDTMLTVVENVMNGSISILNNPYCLYFNNPSKLPEGYDMGWLSQYMIINNHVFYTKAGEGERPAVPLETENTENVIEEANIEGDTMEQFPEEVNDSSVQTME